jgi:hypothetical protein
VLTGRKDILLLKEIMALVVTVYLKLAAHLQKRKVKMVEISPPEEFDGMDLRALYVAAKKYVEAFEDEFESSTNAHLGPSIQEMKEILGC